MIFMISHRGIIASMSEKNVDYALVDSSSGVVACPFNYAPEVPLTPPNGNVRPMVNATGGSIV